MDWPLIRRATLRYTVLSAGLTVAGALAVSAVTPVADSVALAPVIGLGFVVLLYLFGGSNDVQRGTAITTVARGIGNRSLDEPDDQIQSDPRDVKLLFFAVGLIALGLTAILVL